MTGRLPFDPGKMAPKPATDEPLTVSGLSARIDAALKQGIPKAVRVRGEVSGFRERTHWYFDLKDAGSVVSAVMFASSAAKAGGPIANGQEVIANGRIDFYAPQGKVSLIVTSIARVGAGELELKFRQLCEELRSLGWFAPERKKRLPSFVRRIAVITSRTGAALQDVLDTARRRLPAVEIVLVDVRVQGVGAAAEIAEAVRAVGGAHARLGIDAMLITRGGGSMEDLWAFNERVVAEAIVGCPIPVVAAIGHETDTTIAELVADERCATPTQAAMRLVPDRAELARQVDALWRRGRSDVARRLVNERRHLESMASRPALASASGLISLRAERLAAMGRGLATALRQGIGEQRALVARLENRLERVRPAAWQQRQRELVRGLGQRMRRGLSVRLGGERKRDAAVDLAAAMRRAFESRAERLDGLESLLEAVSPVQVLERGYSMTLDSSGRLVRSSKSVRAGEAISTRLADGVVRSRVEGSDEQVLDGAGRARKRLGRKHKTSEEAGPGLFGG